MHAPLLHANIHRVFRPVEPLTYNSTWYMKLSCRQTSAAYLKIRCAFAYLGGTFQPKHLQRICPQARTLQTTLLEIPDCSSPSPNGPLYQIASRQLEWEWLCLACVTREAQQKGLGADGETKSGSVADKALALFGLGYRSPGNQVSIDHCMTMNHARSNDGEILIWAQLKQ